MTSPAQARQASRMPQDDLGGIKVAPALNRLVMANSRKRQAILVNGHTRHFSP